MPDENDPDFNAAKNAVAAWRFNHPISAVKLTLDEMVTLAAELAPSISIARERATHAELVRIINLIQANPADRGEGLEMGQGEAFYEEIGRSKGGKVMDFIPTEWEALVRGGKIVINRGIFDDGAPEEFRWSIYRSGRHPSANREGCEATLGAAIKAARETYRNFGQTRDPSFPAETRKPKKARRNP